MKSTGLAVLTFAIALSASAGPEVVLVRAPQGVVQPLGSPVQTDSFVLANAGSGRVGVTVLPAGSFFTVTPTSFTLVPGFSQTVTIHPNLTAAGFYSGVVNVTVAGVPSPMTIPVRMLAGTPPPGSVVPSASNLVVIPGPAGASHSGTLSIANRGDAPMKGILVADAPWVVPQGDVISIAPRNNATVSFLSARSTRGAIIPLGAIAANLRVLYVKGTAQPASQDPSLAATLIDITKAPVSAAVPPPSAPGETILFLPVVTDVSGLSTDVYFANRGSAPLSSELQLFYTPTGADVTTSVLAGLGALGPGVAAWYPFAPSSLFNVGNVSGTVQVRSHDPESVAIATTRSIVPDGTNRYVTAMPVLRSDRAIAAGDRVVFAGIEKSAAAHTDIVLQETAGSAGAYTIDFYDAAGAPLPPSRTGSLLPFGSVALSDVAPDRARSARVTNAGSVGARLSGLALVVDNTTLDTWTVVDSSRDPAPTNDVVIPVPVNLPPSSSFDVWMTNASSSPVVVTLGDEPLPSRSHAVRRGSKSGDPGPQSVLLAAGETRDVPVTNRPYVRIGGPAGAISATGRLRTTTSNLGAFGTGIPAIASDLAAGAGGHVSHFFRTNDVPNVAPPALLVVEVANKPATVHVNVAYNFPAGGVDSSHAEVSRDFEIGPSQLLSIPDLVRAIIGGPRDSLRTLINVVVDVQVTAGDGRVLSYLQSTDASGDLTLSTD